MIHFALVLALNSTVAAHQSTTPKTIVHTRSSPFCTALRENVGPAVKGLMLNERLILRGSVTLVKIGDDYRNAPPKSSFNAAVSAGVSTGAAALTLDNERLLDLAATIAHNGDLIDKLLASPRFVAAPKTADDRALATMKAQLLHAKAGQSAALNVLSGLAETTSLDDFVNQGNGSIQMAGDLHDPSVASFLGAGPLSDSGALMTPAQGAMATDPLLNDPALRFANQFALASPVGHFYAELLVIDRLTHAAETEASATIVAEAAGC